MTLTNALLGTTAVFSLIAPLPGSLDRGSIFVLLVTLGLIFDALDGLVARRFGITRAGRMLDSLSDAITFGVAPGAFVVATLEVRLLPAVLFFVGCAMYRLALFTTLDSDKPVFFGLPSPIAGIALLLSAVSPVAWHFTFVLAVLLGGLMVSGIRYPKLRGRYLPALVVLSGLAMAHLVLYFAVPTMQDLVVASGLGIAVAMVLGAPFLAPRLEEE